MENGDEGPVTGGTQLDWEVLGRFLAGESPAGEADAVRAWLAEDPARHDVLDALDTTLNRVSAPPADLDVEAALARVHARMDAPETPVIPLRAPIRPPSTAARRWAPAPWLRAAAAVVLLLGLGWLGWRMLDGGGAPLAFSTGVGERDSVRLPDGTRVVLGPASRLTLARGYGERARQVELRGEALFDVPHDDSRPFTVHAGGAWVRDIGTTFSVQADSAAGVRVVVTAGAVAVRTTEEPSGETVLRQGDRATLTAGRVRAERAAATEEDVAWAQGRLVFRDAPFDQVAAELRRWYGIQLRAGDATVAGRRLTASFHDEPPDRVLQVVSLALGADLSVRGDTAVLRAAPPGAPR